MRFIKQLLTATFALALGASVMATTIELAGVKVDDHDMIGGTKVPLNGAGIRVKFFKIYVGELFVTKKVRTLEELIAAPGPKRLKMTFLRDVDATSFGKLLTRGVQDNVPKEQMSKMVPGLIRMSDYFSLNRIVLHPLSRHLDRDHHLGRAHIVQEWRDFPCPLYWP